MTSRDRPRHTQGYIASVTKDPAVVESPPFDVGASERLRREIARMLRDTTDRQVYASVEIQDFCLDLLSILEAQPGSQSN